MELIKVRITQPLNGWASTSRPEGKRKDMLTPYQSYQSLHETYGVD